MILGHVATVTLDTIIGFDTDIAFVIPLVPC
jgi:hypothetical protein